MVHLACRPSNTVLWVQLKKYLDNSRLNVGHRFSGQIAEAVVLNGKDVVPKSAAVEGHVSNKQTAQTQGSSGLLSLELDRLFSRWQLSGEGQSGDA